MRVISGSARGVKLKSVPGTTTRPILDRVKTALFDMLRSRIEGAIFLDLFAGSGGVGIEALSQGAASCIFIDIERRATETVKSNLKSTSLTHAATVRTTDAFSYLKNVKKEFDIIFVAPPQYQSLWIQTLHAIAERPSLLSAKGEVIVQIDPKEYEPVLLTKLAETKQKRYGNTLLVFYSVTEKS